MNNSNTKKKKIDFIGLLSLKFVDWFSPKSNLTDDEVDDYIDSVRADRREHSRGAL